MTAWYAELVVPAREIEREHDAETRIAIHNLSWRDYDAIVKAFGDDSGVRLAYLKGTLEITSPSGRHERIKKNVARFLEVYAMAMDLPLVGFGSTTFRSRPKERGAEPDECYVLDEKGREPAAPHLVIEVVLSSWLVDKLAIYSGLGVKELWLLRKGALEIHVLRGDAYRRSRRSRLFPKLDLDLLMSFAHRDDQTRAAREYYDLLTR